jgi:hypothetical protein
MSRVEVRARESIGVSQLPAGLAPAIRTVLHTSAREASRTQRYARKQELRASDRASDDFFGVSVSLSASGRIALIGAEAKNSFEGAAYVFVRNGRHWREQQELRASDGAVFGSFGHSVALSDNGRVALIAAPGKDAAKGAAYVFARHGKTYVEQQALQAPDGASGDFFGSSVALSATGRTALIGAPLKDGVKGAGYVFVRNGRHWREQHELRAADAASNDSFAHWVSLSASGGVALIGAPQKDSYTGAAYVFARRGKGYVQRRELHASDAAPGDRFGITASLSASGGVALIGARGKRESTGAAYLFARRGKSYAQEQKLKASDGARNDYFGITAVLGDGGCIALIGAEDKNGAKGAAYVFARRGKRFRKQQELKASDGAPGDHFGHVVTLSDSGGIALIGAGDKDGFTGAAYVYALQRKKLPAAAGGTGLRRSC